MPFCRANDLSLYYEVGGSGTQPVLFISGTGGDLRNKPNVFDSPLASAFQVVGYDQRGLGQSDKPQVNYTMADYADDAAALVGALELPTPIPIVGVSFGGMVAQELVLRHPHLVSAAVLACTSSGGAGGASYPLHELAQLPEEERVLKHVAASDTRRTEAWQRDNPERWRQLLEMARGATRDDRDEAGSQRQLQARASHDTYSRLGNIDIPVLIAAGRYDGVAPPANQEAMAAQIPDAELRWFEGGHMFLIQDKTAYPSLIDWLRVKV